MELYEEIHDIADWPRLDRIKGIRFLAPTLGFRPGSKSENTLCEQPPYLWLSTSRNEYVNVEYELLKLRKRSIFTNISVTANDTVNFTIEALIRFRSSHN